jgi:hypothetical protein
MKNKKIYLGILTTGLLLGAAYSCKKDLDTTNENVITTDKYFKTAAELTLGTNSIYSVIHSSSLVAREWYFVHDMRSDENAPGGAGLEGVRLPFLLGTVEPTNAVMNAVWNGLYTVIHRSNTVIDNGPNVTDNVAVKNKMVAEAKYFRGWAYFELVSKWGGVPLYTTTVKGPTEFQPRAKAEDVYAQIAKDLNEAAAALPGKSTTDRGRATASAANALLGRVLMQTGDYAGAKSALLKIPTTGADGYSLTPRYLDNFEEETEFNSESIFEVIFVDRGDDSFNWGSPSGDGPGASQATVRNQEYNPVAWRNLIPSNKILNEFEVVSTGNAKDDPRYSYTFYQAGDKYNNDQSVLTDADVNGNTSVVNGVTKKVSWRKYNIIYKESKARAGFHPAGNNQRIIRYAEVLLMLAECENELGNIGTATTGAIGYLNQIRARPSVSMPLYPTVKFPVGTKAEVIRAIMHEKMVELANEEIRNVDILRWRKKGYFATDPLSYFKANRDELLPIPLAEIDNNPKLASNGLPAQNPGY